MQAEAAEGHRRGAGAGDSRSNSNRHTSSSWPARLRHIFLTKEGLVGDYDYSFFFVPSLPFRRRARRAPPFFGLDDRLPVVLALVLGLQHALAMLAGIIVAPLTLTGSAGANLPQDVQQYVVSTSLIVSGVLSLIQITRFHIYKTP